MTDHIIKAAKAAGGTTYTNRHYPDAPAAAFGPEALARFYAIARAEALEDAAKVAEAQHEEDRPSDYAYAIRALKEQDAAIAAGKGEA